MPPMGPVPESLVRLLDNPPVSRGEQGEPVDVEGDAMDDTFHDCVDGNVDVGSGGAPAALADDPRLALRSSAPAAPPGDHPCTSLHHELHGEREAGE
eukprot:9489649-Pyramimonas_sp.AAC.1